MNDGPISVKVDPLLAELVPKFLERSRGTLAELQAAARSGDFVGARRIGHALFGTASSFGFDEIAEIGKRVEQAAHAGDAGSLQSLAERLAAHLARVRPVFD